MFATSVSSMTDISFSPKLVQLIALAMHTESTHEHFTIAKTVRFCKIACGVWTAEPVSRETNSRDKLNNGSKCCHKILAAEEGSNCSRPTNLPQKLGEFSPKMVRATPPMKRP